MPRLPPLPPSRTWFTHFPRKYLPISPDRDVRATKDRVLVANRALTDQFVQSLKLSTKDVVLETYAGVGQLTRSLVNGGDPGSLMQEYESWKGVKGFAEWDLEGEAPDIQEDTEKYPRPKLVIANEPSAELLVRGMGLDRSTLIEGPKEVLNRQMRENNSLDHPEHEGIVRPEQPPQALHIVESPYANNLLLSNTSPYIWPTMPKILAHELVTPHLQHQPFSGDIPPLTVVSQMPDGMIGEQLFAQWVASASGGKSWIWKWGRVRLGLLVGKGIYDRIMAQPGENSYCKLSIITTLLFDIKPLPPYHTPVVITKKKPTKPPVKPEQPDTTTYPQDFYPHSKSAGHATALTRPPLQGVLLTPKLGSHLIPRQKDAWDYVLRKCFVRPNSSVVEALQVLAFGGENLIAKIEGTEMDHDGSGFGGVDVNRFTRIKDVTPVEWTRVVDVFDRWAFKPENLYIEHFESDNREIGQSI